MSLNVNTFIRPTGFRKLNLYMLATRDRADQFTGVPRGTAKPLTYLSAFQEAEPYLGLPSQAFKLISWLVKQTMPVDWEEGSRPIAWPSARRQQEFLNLSAARVKALNRALYEAGLFVIRDNPQGKRYGRRDPSGRIIEAFGFDLTPLAERHAEFVRLAGEARTERNRMKELRGRITLARRAIRQAGEMLQLVGPAPESWPRIEADIAALTTAARRSRHSEELAVAANVVERLKSEAEQLVKASTEAVDSSPVVLVSEPHTTSTNLSIDLSDTVIATEKSSGATANDCSHSHPSSPEPTSALKSSPERTYKVHVDELCELAPRLAQYLGGAAPSWRDVVDAAGSWLRHELGVSTSLWNEACRIMGRETAALVLAMVSTKPAEHFSTTPGAYFGGMVRRAEKGELRLERSLWKLRDLTYGKHAQRAARRMNSEVRPQ